MKEKIEDKLQYIKDAGFELTDYETVDMLYTLIQEEKKEAVEGFADLVYESFRNHDLKIHALIEEYLESEGK
jgi:ferritin